MNRWLLQDMPNGFIPTPHAIKVDTRGAVILQEESPEVFSLMFILMGYALNDYGYKTRDSRGIYFPNHIEPVSHIAVDVSSLRIVGVCANIVSWTRLKIGGSLAKVIYFTRSPVPPSSSSSDTESSSASSDSISTPDDDDEVRVPGTPAPSRSKFTGALTPLTLDPPRTSRTQLDPTGRELRGALLRRATLQNVPGGSLNFERFETDNIHECVEFIQHLIDRSAKVNRVSIEEMRKSVKIMATGGGAHKYYELFQSSLGVEVRREDEMECLITGLNFITSIPNEVYTFSDELIDSVSHSKKSNIDLERPSPYPPRYGVSFDAHPSAQLPCLLVNIGSGVSIIKVDEDGKFERVSGTSLGGGTLWGLLSLLTPATSFDGWSCLSEPSSFLLTCYH